MKKIWKIRKEKEGVSPVIATILMVAITVVLAAVLYVMVIGFTGPPKNAPIGSWNEAKVISQTEGKLVFGAFSYDVAPLGVEIIVQANGSNIGKITIPSNTGSAPQAMTWIEGPIGASASYYDYRPAGELINSGDYIEFDGLQPATMYSFEVFHTPTGSLASMSGVTGQFVTPS